MRYDAVVMYADEEDDWYENYHLPIAQILSPEYKTVVMDNIAIPRDLTDINPDSSDDEIRLHIDALFSNDLWHWCQPFFVRVKLPEVDIYTYDGNNEVAYMTVVMSIAYHNTVLGFG